MTLIYFVGMSAGGLHLLPFDGIAGRPSGHRKRLHLQGRHHVNPARNTYRTHCPDVADITDKNDSFMIGTSRGKQMQMQACHAPEGNTGRETTCQKNCETVIRGQQSVQLLLGLDLSHLQKTAIGALRLT